MACLLQTSQGAAALPAAAWCVATSPHPPYAHPQVTSYSLALREIDTVQDEEEYVPNALEVILRKVRGGTGLVFLGVLL